MDFGPHANFKHKVSSFQKLMDSTMVSNLWMYQN